MALHRLGLHGKPPAACRAGVLSIGNFDGVHKGHLALLSSLLQAARSTGGPAVAVTFDPHPLQLLRPEQFQPVLTTVHDRAELVQNKGVDHVIILETTLELLNLRAEDFFQRIVRERLDARRLAEGPNFGFGHNREGDCLTLVTLSRKAGIEDPIIVPPLLMDGKPVSSSRVRSALVRGDVQEAARFLGREYSLHGTVGTGQRRGQSIGFPTANLEAIPTLIPGDGVYAVRVRWQGRTWSGAANVGPNPTFGELARKVEVHLIDFQGDLYGQELTVTFVQRLRDTRPFPGKDQLVEQLRRDIANSRQIVG
jgi:riboflavin kinase/FMN adenylyltransferase